MRKSYIPFGVALAALLCLYPSNSRAQDPAPDCPEGYKCVPDKVAEEWLVILKERQCQDTALDALERGESTEDFEVTIEPHAIIVTKDGQVFNPEDLTVRLKWCSTDLKVSAKSNLEVRMKPEPPEPTWGFRLRVRLGANFWPKTLFTGMTQPLFEPVLGLEPFYVKNFHLLTYAGFQTFGLGVGLDLTRNANIYLGAGARWATAEVGPVMGISLSFN